MACEQMAAEGHEGRQTDHGGPAERLLEGASVLGVIADHANHDEALRSALRRILVG